MAVCVCVAMAFNDGGRWSLFRYVCSLVRPEGVVGLGGLVSPSVYKYALGSHSVAEERLCACVCAWCMCVRVFMTPLQPGELEAITGQQGCYGDQWCQRGATSVGCLSRQVFLFLFLSALSLSVQSELTAWVILMLSEVIKPDIKISSLSSLVFFSEHGT